MIKPALNEATPDWAYYPIMKNLNMAPDTPFQQVRSYLTTDQNGQKIVANVTEPKHTLSPGMVIRYVTESPSGTTIQTEGAGLGWLQGPNAPWLAPDAIASVWRRQGEQILRDAAR